MELALYCPVCGYYEKEEDTIGRRGDFCSSVSVGSLFGELLGYQFADWLAGLRGAGTVQIVEAGAHNGRLARDILAWLCERRPELFSRLEYWIAEPSARRREWQRKMLADYGDAVRWLGDIGKPAGGALGSLGTPQPSDASEIAGGCVDSIQGVIFANELLDAMPLRRLGWDAKECVWFEWGVASQGGRFVWERITNDAHRNPGGAQADRSLVAQPFGVTPELLEVLPDGYIVEDCPAAEAWLRKAAKILASGKLVTIDYGWTENELFMPERKNGTLRAFYRHGICDDILARPGEQDITAHVRFGSLRVVGESEGLRTELFTTQERFLTAVAARAWQGAADFGKWTPERTRQFQSLTHPDHLGHPFRVLVQGREDNGPDRR